MPVTDPTGKVAVAEGLRVMEGLNLSVTLGYCYLSRWWNVTLSRSGLSGLECLHKGTLSTHRNPSQR